MGCPSTLSPLWMMLPFACITPVDLQRMFDTVTVFGGRMAADTAPVVTSSKHLGLLVAPDLPRGAAIQELESVRSLPHLQRSLLCKVT